MELDRKYAYAFTFAFVLLGTGCGSSRSGSPVAAPRTPLSTVHLMAAELRDADDAPKVGKSQRSDASVVDDEDGKRDESTRGGPDRKRGGFSGYK